MVLEITVQGLLGMSRDEGMRGREEGQEFRVLDSRLRFIRFQGLGFIGFIEFIGL